MADSGRREADTARAVSWYPGHMLKAQKRLAEDAKQVDVVLELRDARLPLLSGNPEIQRIIGPKARLVLFNKASLADPQRTAGWSRYFAAQGLRCLFLDADSGKALNLILPHVDALVAPLTERYRARAIRPPQPRLMIVGMPNVGKSTLINRLVHGHRQKVAPMPGVTRQAVWVNLKSRYQLMDTPGVMLPRIAREEDALLLTWIGSIKDTILGAERVALALLQYILAAAPADLSQWMDASVGQPGPGDILDRIGTQRGMLGPGGMVNRNLAAEWLLHHYRDGQLGRYTFEAPPDAGA
jgi:ribosome biogenesis GTPase A